MAATDPNSLNAITNCYLCAGTVGQAQLWKIGLLVEQLKALNPAQAVDPQTLLNVANCYLCGSNASSGDLFELALLSLIAQNTA